MKLGPFFRTHWDTLVLLLITMAGLVYTLHNLYSQEQWRPGSPTIALVQPSREPTSRSDRKQAIIDLGCLHEETVQNAHYFRESVVRVRGRLCEGFRGRVPEEGAVKVMNITTGYESTVFYQDEIFFSDFLLLKAGKNVVQVTWKGRSDKAYRMRLTEVFAQ